MKALTPENHLERDPTNKAYAMIDAETGEKIEFTAERWATEVCKVELDEDVPPDVRHVFEVGRAIMIYGFYYYPLYAVGMGKACQAAEAAVTLRCEEMGAPKGTMETLKRKLEWLRSQDVISEDEWHRWDALRSIRNTFAHQNQSLAMPPGAMLGHLWHLAQDIDYLLADAPAR